MFNRLQSSGHQKLKVWQPWAEWGYAWSIIYVSDSYHVGGRDGVLFRV